MEVKPFPDQSLFCSAQNQQLALKASALLGVRAPADACTSRWVRAESGAGAGAGAGSADAVARGQPPRNDQGPHQNRQNCSRARRRGGRVARATRRARKAGCSRSGLRRREWGAARRPRALARGRPGGGPPGERWQAERMATWWVHKAAPAPQQRHQWYTDARRAAPGRQRAAARGRGPGARRGAVAGRGARGRQAVRCEGGERRRLFRPPSGLAQRAVGKRRGRWLLG